MKPMLATDADLDKLPSTPYIIQPKIDRVARRHMKRARESLRLEEMIELLKGSQYATIS